MLIEKFMRRCWWGYTTYGEEDIGQPTAARGYDLSCEEMKNERLDECFIYFTEGPPKFNTLF